MIILALAALSDAVLGLWFAVAEHVSGWDGLYFAVTTGTTVGYGDISPHGRAAHLIAVAMMIIAIPLFGASFSLFTSGITAGHIRRHLDTRLREHHEEIIAHLKGTLEP
jgi:voltage-gated potassium channel